MDEPKKQTRAEILEELNRPTDSAILEQVRAKNARETSRGSILFVGVICIGVLGLYSLFKSDADVDQGQAQQQEAAQRRETEVALAYLQAIAKTDLKVQWRKGGFGNVMIADLRLRNDGTREVRDVIMTCEMIAPSGTKLGALQHQVFQSIMPGDSTVLREQNLGLVHSQTESVACRVADLTVSSSPQ